MLNITGLSRFLAIFLGISCTANAGAPVVTHLFPAGGQRGKTTSVKATGKFSTGKLTAWCSRKDASVTVMGKSTTIRTLTVKIPTQAAPGVCWIRIVNEEGASALRPFLIGMLADVAEKEPNDTVSQAKTLTSPYTVNGILSKSGDVDTFGIQARKGTTLVASATANSVLGSPMDGVLQVVSSRGFVVAQNDDDAGMDPRIAYVVPEDGVYFVRVFAFPTTPNSSVRLAGAATYIYRLTITSGPFLDFTYPLVAQQGQKSSVALVGWNLNNSLKQIQIPSESQPKLTAVWSEGMAGVRTIGRVNATVWSEETWRPAHRKNPGQLPAVISGRLTKAGEVDRFRFVARQKDRLTISISSRSLGLPTDPVLRVLDSTGKLLKRVETRSSTAIDETLTLTIPKAGPFEVEVSDLHGRGGPRFAYNLSVVRVEPDFRLSVASDVFLLSSGKTLTIPVTVTRLNGFRDEISFSVTGLPADVKLKSVKSLAKGATAKSVKLELTLLGKKAKFVSGPIRIVGRTTGKTITERDALFSISELAAKTADLWLSVRFLKKKNGQKLPKTK